MNIIKYTNNIKLFLFYFKTESCLLRRCFIFLKIHLVDLQWFYDCVSIYLHYDNFRYYTIISCLK